MKKFIFIPILFIAIYFASCDKVENPYPVNTTDLDTTIYPGNWTDYVSNEWPEFTTNTIVDRNILIEDFTGHKCIFCPLAATEAEKIVEEHPERVFVATIHASSTGLGSFQELSPPYYTHDFTNLQGLEIGEFFGSIPGSSFVGNPHGAVSRILKNGQNTAGFDEWANLTNSALLENSLKIKLQGKLNYFPSTNGFYLHTEIEKLPSVTNEIAQVVYFIEDSIIKPQAFPGKDSLNYVHHKVMRNCIDGKAFGRTLTDADKNSNGKYYLDYSYKLPVQFPANNSHILVFVFDKITFEIYQVIKLDII